MLTEPKIVQKVLKKILISLFAKYSIYVHRSKRWLHPCCIVVPLHFDTIQCSEVERSYQQGKDKKILYTISIISWATNLQSLVIFNVQSQVFSLFCVAVTHLWSWKDDECSLALCNFNPCLDLEVFPQVSQEKDIMFVRWLASMRIFIFWRSPDAQSFSYSWSITPFPSTSYILKGCTLNLCNWFWRHCQSHKS